MYPDLAFRQFVFPLLLLLGLGLTACGSPQTAPSEPIAMEERSTSEEAARYEVLALQSAEEHRRAVYQYLAAQAWYETGFEDRAFFLLVNLNPLLLSPEQRLGRSLTLAHFHSSRGQPTLALGYLEDDQILSDLTNVDAVQKSQWASFTADLNAHLGNYERAIKTYDFALSYGAEDADELRTSLWNSLTLIDALPSGPFLSAELPGWIALAEINNQSTGTVSDQYLSYLLWQDRFYSHPAHISPPASFSILSEIASGDRPKTAVLLPLTGPLASAGSAILDGFMSARAAEYDANGLNPADPLAPEIVKIYDTHAQSLYSIIRELEAEQFDLVIGPLDRDRVADYANLMPQIPSLALNNLPEDALLSEKPILGLSLNVEDEAVQAAVKALQEGHQSSMVLVPNSTWGDRAGFAFAEAWEAEGGTVMQFENFGDSTTHADLLEASLQVDESNTRKRELQQLLGKIIEFTPRRRQDIDALFLAASPAQARQLKPMLAFFFAEDIPVYSTSSIYSGVADSKADRDLDGIQFSTLPWILDASDPLRASIAEHTPPTTTGLKMQAIGVDSYYLSQRLTQFLRAPDTVYRGAIGKMGRSLDEHGNSNNLTRKQVWAEFRSGQARTATAN